jgi:hypothetical protein
LGYLLSSWHFSNKNVVEKNQTRPTKMNHLTKNQRNNRRQNQKDLLKQRDPEFTCAFNVGSSITINVSLSALFNFLFLCVDFNGDITWVGALNKPNKYVCIGDTLG